MHGEPDAPLDAGVAVAERDNQAHDAPEILLQNRRVCRRQRGFHLHESGVVSSEAQGREALDFLFVGLGENNDGWRRGDNVWGVCLGCI